MSCCLSEIPRTVSQGDVIASCRRFFVGGFLLRTISIVSGWFCGGKRINARFAWLRSSEQLFRSFVHLTIMHLHINLKGLVTV